MIRNIFLVGLGGAFGAMLRYGISILFTALNWSSDIATFLVNVIGSFAIGLLSGCLPQGGWLLFATVGLCGGFTTFSTFSLQSLTFLQSGRYGAAALYILGSVAVCILFALLGCWAAGRLRG